MQFCKTPIVLALFFVVIFIAGCGSTSNVAKPSMYNPTDNHHYKWTVLLYMDGKNNLAPEAIKNLNDLESAGSTNDVAIVAEVGHKSGYTGDTATWDELRRYFVMKDNNYNSINSLLVGTLPNQTDMASQQTLSDFIQWGVSRYPADHYALVLWDHGGGWYTNIRAMSAPKVMKSIFVDDTSGNEMSLGQLSSALNPYAKKFDLIVFDACLMGMIEVATSVKNSGSYMVASEDDVPGDGMPYAKVMSSLVANPGITADALGKGFVDEYYNAYGTSFDGGITLSLINLNTISQLESATNGLASAVNGHLSDIKTTVVGYVQSSQTFDSTDRSYTQYRDLYDFASGLSSTSYADIGSASENLKQAFQSTVIYERHNTSVPNAHGLSIYLPDPSFGSFSTWYSQYKRLQFSSDAPAWPYMISKY